MSNLTGGAREVVERLLQLDSPTPADVARVKCEVAMALALKRIPSNAEVIQVLKPRERYKLVPLLRRKASRMISGVTVVAVMSKPQACPQAEPCAYCPGGPAFGVPQSYTGHEPAALRGLQYGFDPYLQVTSRIVQLKAIGHRVDKVELVVMGGTFPATELSYQEWFIKRCLDALNGVDNNSLEEAKLYAEHSRIRNVGITVETRPDCARPDQVDALLSMGVTRVELGVQNPDDDIYAFVGRRHTVKDVEEATRVLKDAGLKVAYHLMPGLPGSNIDKDLKAFQQVFTDQRFKPDMLKIYPCLVIKGTRLYEWYVQGKYKPYSTEEAVNLIAEVKKHIPRWVRIMRVQRDIPAGLIVAGVKNSNLRQLIHQRLSETGSACNCIRCREVGHRWLKSNIWPDEANLHVKRETYEASGGEENFLSVEDTERNILVGYLRLRVPSEKAHRHEITAAPSAIVRELHVYGPLVPVGKHVANAWQHKGYGTLLLAEAERLAREEYGLRKLLVISALGTKEYYMRHGYKRDGVYVSKRLEA